MKKIMSAFKIFLMVTIIALNIMSYHNIDNGWNMKIVGNVCDKALWHDKCFTASEIYLNGLRMHFINLVLIVLYFTVYGG